MSNVIPAVIGAPGTQLATVGLAARKLAMFCVAGTTVSWNVGPFVGTASIGSAPACSITSHVTLQNFYI